MSSFFSASPLVFCFLILLFNPTGQATKSCVRVEEVWAQMNNVLMSSNHSVESTYFYRFHYPLVSVEPGLPTHALLKQIERWMENAEQNEVHPSCVQYHLWNLQCLLRVMQLGTNWNLAYSPHPPIWKTNLEIQNQERMLEQMYVRAQIEELRTLWSSCPHGPWIAMALHSIGISDIKKTVGLHDPWFIQVFQQAVNQLFVFSQFPDLSPSLQSLFHRSRVDVLDDLTFIAIQNGYHERAVKLLKQLKSECHQHRHIDSWECHSNSFDFYLDRYAEHEQTWSFSLSFWESVNRIWNTFL